MELINIFNKMGWLKLFNKMRLTDLFIKMGLIDILSLKWDILIHSM